LKNQLKKNATELRNHIAGLFGYQRCELCSANGMDCGGLDTHHVVRRSQCGGHGLDNLILLCHRCHMAIHGQGTHRPNVECTTEKLVEIIEERNAQWQS